MAYTRRNTTDGVTVMNKDLYDNLQDGIEQFGVTPQMFGAKGDGVTNDSASIKQAIEYAINKGLNVYFPLGTYVISSPILLENINSLNIFGAGNSQSRASILICRNNNCFELSGCRNCKIGNFAIISPLKAIFLVGERNFNNRFFDISIYDCVYGIHITSSTGYTYFDRVTINCSEITVKGIYICTDDSNDVLANYIYFNNVVVDALEVKDKGKDLVLFTKCYYIFLTGCDFCNTNGKGIEFGERCSNIYILNTEIFNVDTCLYVSDNISDISGIFITNTELKGNIGLYSGNNSHPDFYFSCCNFVCLVSNISNLQSMCLMNSCRINNNFYDLQSKVYRSCDTIQNSVYVQLEANSTKTITVKISNNRLFNRYRAISPNKDLVILSQSFDNSTGIITIKVQNISKYSLGDYFFIY